MRRNYPVHKRNINIKTAVRKWVVNIISGVFLLFFVASFFTAFGPNYSVSSSSVHEWSDSLFDKEDFVYLLGVENPYFTQNLPEDSEPFDVSSVMFELATSINPDDPRSLLGRELPGFALFDGRIHTAGKGMDFTSMSIESAPPMEVLMQDREVATNDLEETDGEEGEREESVEDISNKDPVVHIVHSHNRESFFPELKDADVAFHDEVNITLVGERLGQRLHEKGIPTEVDKSDINAKLNDRGWNYSESYDMSREIVTDAIDTNDELAFFFDVHRDAQPRETTTVDINGEPYARTLFVIGENHESYAENLQFANELHEQIEEKYPGLNRGVIGKGGSGSNGRYNQDLSENSVLIEVGGVDNTLEEAYRSVDAFAEVFSEYYWEQKEGSGE
ncbi:stage II sporulation protein P [Texcoconibacillus texcoconensis]|uniref:Stage II sporulation protein P n=1 Tax=Texcoconibacillus texcoconensis TaxID=1095777 RepID=A0A840QRK0_9BACI|nr:stage II sporulation protein P [Texcoconibacillus texcoconensis]MBB5173958.1 stage II sporulation protein P [Texcoconibacillus texcoconensis]